MELRQLKTFVAIAEARNFTVAGRRVGLTQSAVSAQLKALEDEVAERLVERTRRSVRLTAAGDVFLGHARDLLRRAEEARRAVGGLRGRARPTVRIGAGPTAGARLLPRILGRFVARHPDIEPVVVTGASAAIIEQVLRGATDVGIVTLPGTHARLDLEVLDREELVLIVPPRHRLAARRRIMPADLSGERLVLYAPGSITRAIIDRFLRAHAAAMAVDLTVDSAEPIVELVKARVALSILPMRAVADAVRRGTLRAIRLAPAGLFRDVGLAVLRQPPSPSLAAFLDVARGPRRRMPPGTPAR